jgi:hypothetical protein
MPDGYYFVEVTDDGKNILNDKLYGPYRDAAEARIAARKTPTLSDFNRAIAQLEREGHVRRMVGDDGVPRYKAIGEGPDE